MTIRHLYFRTIACYTFIGLSGCSGYTTENGQPVYQKGISDDSGGYTYAIEGADRSSFRVLSGGDYAKDNTTVYFRGVAIKSAEAESFVVVSEEYGKDAFQGFYRNEAILGSDGKTIEAIPGGWVRDRHDVYAGNRALHACDPGTFRNLDFGWHLDSLCAYSAEQKVHGADVKTFQLISFAYAKDALRVYTNVISSRNNFGVIDGADPSTFHLINGRCEVCARDKYRCYLNGAVKNCEGYEEK